MGAFSESLKNFLWNGLAKESRATYRSSQKSYESWCVLQGWHAYPATERTLGEFITIRAVGSSSVRKVSPDTIQANLFALRSVHLDRRLDQTAFDSPWIKRILSGIRRCYTSPTPKKAEPITVQILEKITCLETTSIQDLNFSVASRVAFAGFLRMGEFTVKPSQTVEAEETFQATRLTRSDVTFSTDDSHAILRLKRSKSDTNHRGVEIVLSADPDDRICPVRALRTLFLYQPELPTAPLFGWDNRPLERTWMISQLRSKLTSAGVILSPSYSGHSFRRGAAQRASDMGLLHEDIQALGRWNSDAFKRYFKQNLSQKMSLSLRFLGGLSALPGRFPSRTTTPYNVAGSACFPSCGSVL